MRPGWPLGSTQPQYATSGWSVEEGCCPGGPQLEMMPTATRRSSFHPDRSRRCCYSIRALHARREGARVDTSRISSPYAALIQTDGSLDGGVAVGDPPSQCRRPSRQYPWTRLTSVSKTNGFGSFADTPSRSSSHC